MNYADLQWFRENVAEPAMQRLLANTTIPDGFCCIDKLDIAFLDGRSCGTDSHIKASGLQYKDGSVEAYSYEATDFDVHEFAKAHQNCVFLSGGSLHIYDQLEETEVNSFIRNIDTFSLLFRGVPQRESLVIVSESMEYLKMKHLQTEAKAAVVPNNKFLCTGISDGHFFSLQQHDIQSDNPYFSFYSVDAVPYSNVPDALEEFMIEHADQGGSVAGDWEQVMDEFRDFLKAGCIERDVEKESIPKPLADQIGNAQDKIKQNTAPSQNIHEPEPGI